MSDNNSLADGVSALLARLGVTTNATQRVDAETIAVEFLSSKGYTGARVTELRWQTMVIACPPHTAAMLKYDIGLLQGRINASIPDAVRQINLRVTPTKDSSGLR